MQAALLERVRTWLFDEALPFWCDVGLDRHHGGVVESLALDGRRPSGVDFKRLRVSCRQLYVFSHAQILGSPYAAFAADHAWDFMVSKFWTGPERGWLRRVAVDGTPVDHTPDLYDYAFTLFALGWRYRAKRDPRALSLAHQTLDFIDRHFRHASGHGFHAFLPPALPREQNPHMHLIEGALALAQSSQETRFLDLANEIAALFRERICRLPEGILPEFFDDAWAPVAGEKGRWIEPGHQFEWAWILAQHQRLSGANNADLVAALVGWAENHGVDRRLGATFNGVRDDGEPLDKGSRVWPNTERIKGWLGLYELTGADPRAALSESAQLLLERYLGPAPSGCWIEAFDACGAPKADVIPASTLYHLFLAFSELLRLGPKLESASR